MILDGKSIAERAKPGHRPTGEMLHEYPPPLQKFPSSLRQTVRERRSDAGARCSDTPSRMPATASQLSWKPWTFPRKKKTVHFFGQLLQIVGKRSRPQFVLPAGLPRGLEHDSVSVQFFTG